MLMAAISFLAGLYPACLINKVRSIETLKGKVETRIRGGPFLNNRLHTGITIIDMFSSVGHESSCDQLKKSIRKPLGSTAISRSVGALIMKANKKRLSLTLYDRHGTRIDQVSVKAKR